MGQRASSGRDEREDDVKRQVDSDINHQKPIYQLVNVKTGRGRLIDIIKAHARYSSRGSLALASCSDDSIATNALPRQPTTDRQPAATTKPIDVQIRELVEPLLYNKGAGKLVPLAELWRYRFGRGAPTTDLGNNDTQTAAPEGGRRLVCWRLEERGFVGETALHICFLLSTPTHMILAQKLLRMFPALINDIYTCDEYFGESSLHMAIVNENIKIVKLLLDHGANVHERCLGSFFLPSDLKDKANGPMRAKSCSSLDSDQTHHTRISISDEQQLNSNYFSTTDTNYDGYCYWGEFPLSFAASLGLRDCYKLLLAKGADPNRQDSLGNSTLHLAVIANRMDMFDLCYANGARLDVYNHLHLSPLTLAAKLRKVDMFFHILTIQRRVQWIFCNVAFLETPLNGIDSIDCSDGTCDDHSVLSIVVSGNSNEHLQMLDGLVSELLQVKWQTFAREKFNSWLKSFLLFLAISSIAYITRFNHHHHHHQDNQQQRHYYLQRSNEASEVLLVCYVLYYVWIISTRVAAPGRKSLRCRLEQAPEVAMFLFTCLLIVACIPLRLFQLRRAEDFVAAIVMFLLPLKLLFFCRASKSLGSFIVMIYKILVNDVLCFVVFLIIFVAGFSQSFLIIFTTHQNNSGDQNSTSNYFVNLFDGIISMHMMALNEFTLVFDQFNSTAYPQLAKLLFCVYMILVSILLINMLIAMLGKTYQDISSQPNESVRQWARALLTVERMWPSRQRLQMLARYSHLLDDGGGDGHLRYYNSTWALTGDNLHEIRLLQELSNENKRNATRLASRRTPKHI